MSSLRKEKQPRWLLSKDPNSANFVDRKVNATMPGIHMPDA